jgi:hypothetical protein
MILRFVHDDPMTDLALAARKRADAESWPRQLCHREHIKQSLGVQK